MSGSASTAATKAVTAGRRDDPQQPIPGLRRDTPDPSTKDNDQNHGLDGRAQTQRQGQGQVAHPIQQRDTDQDVQRHDRDSGNDGRPRVVHGVERPRKRLDQRIADETSGQECQRRRDKRRRFGRERTRLEEGLHNWQAKREQNHRRRKRQKEQRTQRVAERGAKRGRVADLPEPGQGRQDDGRNGQREDTVRQHQELPGIVQRRDTLLSGAPGEVRDRDEIELKRRLADQPRRKEPTHLVTPGVRGSNEIE